VYSLPMKPCQIWIFAPLLAVVTGCGGSASKEAPIAEDVITFQEQLGEYLYDQSQELAPGSGKLLVLVQKEQGVMSRPDHQQILKGLRAKASEIEVAEISLDQIQLGLGLHADAYSEALAGVRPGVVVSLVGLPLGTSLSAPGRNTPLLVLLEPGVPTDLMQTQAKFPHKWRLLSPSAGQAEAKDPAEAYETFSSP